MVDPHLVYKEPYKFPQVSETRNSFTMNAQVGSTYSLGDLGSDMMRTPERLAQVIGTGETYTSLKSESGKGAIRTRSVIQPPTTKNQGYKVIDVAVG